MADPCQKTARKRTVGNCRSSSLTQTSRFIPFTDLVSVDLGYSISIFQGVVLTVQVVGHSKHQLAVEGQLDPAVSTYQRAADIK
ncbi:MAG: hypothetical protein ACI9I0_000662 [Rhodoferax sp.]|jgi:hypothetical protein